MDKKLQVQSSVNICRRVEATKKIEATKRPGGSIPLALRDASPSAGGLADRDCVRWCLGTGAAGALGGWLQLGDTAALDTAPERLADIAHLAV